MTRSRSRKAAVASSGLAASLEVFDMKRLLFGALMLSVATLPAMAALHDGDSAPRFVWKFPTT